MSAAETDLAASFGSTAIDGVAEGIVAVDLDGRARWVNVAAGRLLGVARGAAGGRALAELFRLIDRCRWIPATPRWRRVGPSPWSGRRGRRCCRMGGRAG
jgi:PAS domain-containing protein